MSNAEGEKNLQKKVFFAIGLFFVIILAVVFVATTAQKREILVENEEKEDEKSEISECEPFSLPLSALEIKYSGGDELSFSAKISKKELIEYAEERGLGISSVAPLLPEDISISCTCEARVNREGKYAVLKILEATVNGFSIPEKLLSDIGEINLDFERSLVYN